MTNELQNLRQKIDSLDEELLRVLAKRTETVKEIGKLKKAADLPPFDEKRSKEVMEARCVLGKKLGLSPELVQSLFEQILQYSVDMERTV